MGRGHTGGFSRLEFALAVLIIAVLAGLLLERLNYYREWAEQARTMATIRSLRSALTIRIGEMMIAAEAHRLDRLATENPFRWLEKPPADYCGEAAGSASPAPGCWLYLGPTREIVYRPERSRYFEGRGKAFIRLRLEAVRWQAAGQVRSSSVRLIALEPSRWFGKPVQ